MTEIDAYMLKCSLEALEEGVEMDHIQEECECRMGLKAKSDEEN